LFKKCFYYFLDRRYLNQNVYLILTLILVIYSNNLCFAASAPDFNRGYPNKLVRVVTGYSPGGSDVVLRIVCQKLSERMGQTFIIDYRPGASATIGSDLVAKSSPDGYTLLFISATFSITAATLQKLPFDSLKDFNPIAYIGAVPQILAVHPSLPVRNPKEFIEFAKSRPDKLDYSTAGAGGGYHLTTLLFSSQHGLRFNHIPYKGSSPAIMALMSGEVQFMFPNIIAISPYLGKDRLRALAIASESRSPLAKNIPTFAEAGVTPLKEGTWYGILAPIGTPSAVVTKLNHEISSVIQLKEVKENLEKIGVIISPMNTPEQFSDLIKADITKWDKVVKQYSNLKFD